MGFDEDLRDHCDRVEYFLTDMRNALRFRGWTHDASKWEAEYPAFRRAFEAGRPEYGSPEYHKALESLGDTLREHYAANDHHPEHFPNGLADMDLPQLAELLADWCAAAGGAENIKWDLMGQRFGCPEIIAMLRRTAENMGW